MAEKRMFAKTIIDSDAFLDMPLSTQALYFHLSMRADDDGFLNNPRKISRTIGASEDDLKLLIAKNFIIPFDNGIVVIKHWRIHNYIAKDRYKPTVYEEEMKMLTQKKNGAYTLDDSSYTECIQDVYNSDTQIRLDKNREDKDRLDKSSKDKRKEPYYPGDELLDEAFTDYVAMRKHIKAPMTDKAIKLAMNKLEKLSGGDNDKAIQILNQSVENSWKGLFPLHEDKPKTTEGRLDWIDAIDWNE